MPIDFPNNPISGQTYSYNSITWEYNGVAWDKQGGGGSVGPQGNTGATGPQGNTGATGPVGDYVISFNGLTGAVTGVTTGTANTFIASQTISGPFVDLKVANTIFGVTASYTANNISAYSGASTQTVSFSPSNPSNLVTFPAYTTTLAGLAGTQTFSGTNTFTAIQNFNAGISASGGMTLAGSFQGSTATFRNGNVTINQSSSFGITASDNNLFNIFDLSGYGIKKYFSKYITTTNLSNQTISSIDQGIYTNFGIFKINVKISEGSGSSTLCSISSFILTRSGSTLNWTETSVFNGVNKASFSFSLNGNIIELKITHTVPKLVTGNIYVTEIEQIQ